MSLVWASDEVENLDPFSDFHSSSLPTFRLAFRRDFSFFFLRKKKKKLIIIYLYAQYFASRTSFSTPLLSVLCQGILGHFCIYIFVVYFVTIQIKLIFSPKHL